MANFPLSNKKIWSINILDPKKKEFYYVDLDEAGNSADIKAAKALEYAKYKEKYGKKEIELHEKLQKMNPEDTVEVGIWLTPIKDASIPSRELTDQQYSEMLDAKRNAYAQKEKPVINILKAKNINIRYASQYAPLIYAEVPAKLMAEVENIPDVDGIYLARTFKPMLNMVAQTEKAVDVWNAGITGSGINVAVVEKGKIKFSHPNLPAVSAKDPGGVTGAHATQVAGIIATINNQTYKGISHGVPGLLSANAGSWLESDMIAASEWAITSGANILSNSWGDDTQGVLRGIDKYFDHVVLEDLKTVTAVPGNNYPGENWRVPSPGVGYNIITVGGFDDKDTASWSDDVMWADSGYVDPVSQYGDREKPEVVGVATHGSRYITSTSRREFPFGSPIEPVVGAGTSYASPAVAAEAALLMQADTTLKNWPEVIKAVIMASADHNLEGDTRLSEKDGAGGIDIYKAYDTVRNSRIAKNLLVYSNFPRVYTFSASQNQKVRVVIAWDSHTDNNHPPVNDDLKADLNLIVYNSSGAMMGIPSDSYDNNYEIVEFTAPADGTYSATIYAKRFDGGYEYIGFAYVYV